LPPARVIPFTLRFRGTVTIAASTRAGRSRLNSPVTTHHLSAPSFAGVYRSGMIGNANPAAMQVWMPRWFPDQSFAHGAIEPLLG